jgi:bifunctional N-acetylglucosamine-1-phosphate-uridyltransferase/glucosamine-1-phosphate-acetyltransferase GlmU-like protein
MKADLFIIAAGVGSRMNSNIPKALVPIVDEPCLTTTLQQIAYKFKTVHVVTNILVQNQWTAYFKNLAEKYPELTKNLINVPINSGLGDGHATMIGLRYASENGTLASDEVTVAWGDVFFPNAEIIDELFSNELQGSGLLPAVKENNPYVSLLVDEKMRCISADFSKYGEKHPTGFHDQSVFRFNSSHLYDSLTTIHAAFWKGGRYITPGGELSLLYTFHHMYNINRAAYVYETDYPTLSFNTSEEVATIQQEISKKWKARHQS